MEEALDLSFDRLLMMMMMITRYLQQVSATYVVIFREVETEIQVQLQKYICLH